jgi:hypothetical protein
LISFFRSIGLVVVETTDLRDDSFVPGVWLDHGSLVVNLGVAHVGDVLHEAGHLALIPSCMRDLVRPGQLPGEELTRALDKYCSEHLFSDAQGREDPIFRAILQMGDCEVTAWSYAACSALGVSPEVLFAARTDGTVPYNGGGNEIWEGLDARAYFGINGLQAAGYCTVRDFPTMRRWLAP